MHLRGYSYERLDGSVRGNERWIAVEQFSKSDSDTFAFLLSTRAGGVGLNLTAASVVIFIDSDFNPQNDLQAQARCLRIGQKKSVSVIRLCCPHTVEEIILARGHGKLRLNSRVLAKGQFSLSSKCVDFSRFYRALLTHSSQVMMRTALWRVRTEYLWAKS